MWAARNSAHDCDTYGVMRAGPALDVPPAARACRACRPPRFDPNRPPLRTPGNRRSGEETSMASTARTVVRRRLGALIAGAVVLTALSVATAGASATAPTGVQ